MALAANPAAPAAARRNPPLRTGATAKPSTTTPANPTCSFRPSRRVGVLDQLVRVVATDPRLRVPDPELPPHVGAQARVVMVPDRRARDERDPEAGVRQPEGELLVLGRGAVEGLVEPPEPPERVAAVCRAVGGDHFDILVPGELPVLLVVFELGEPRGRLGLQARGDTPCRSNTVGVERLDEPLDPVGDRYAVSVGEQKQLAARGLRPSVAGRARASMVLGDHLCAHPARDLGRGVGRPVVDHDHFTRHHGLPGERHETALDRGGGVERRNHDRDVGARLAPQG